MGLSNAERQARWREKRGDRIAELQAEVAALKAKLARAEKRNGRAKPPTAKRAKRLDLVT